MIRTIDTVAHAVGPDRAIPVRVPVIVTGGNTAGASAVLIVLNDDPNFTNCHRCIHCIIYYLLFIENSTKYYGSEIFLPAYV